MQAEGSLAFASTPGASDTTKAPTRIHFVSHSFAPADAPLTNVGGMQRVAMELADGLAARSDVRLTTDVLRSRWDRIAWHAPFFLAGLPGRLAALDRSVDIVLFASITSAVAALPAFAGLRAKGVRLAAIAHGLDVTHTNPAYRVAVRSVLPRLDVVLPVSRATAERCRELGARNLKVVPNGVDVARFSRLAAAARTDPDSDGFVIVAIGRQVRRKGFEWLVREVMPRLDASARLVLLGDGPEREAIEHAVVECQVEDRVELRGIVPEAELHACLGRAAVLVMPNVTVEGDMEGFGIVLLEAGAAGVPVVVADLEGMRDVVSPGVTGELVPSADADAWVRTLEALRTDPSRRRTLGAAAAKVVPAKFSWDAVVQRYLDDLVVTHIPPRV